MFKNGHGDTVLLALGNDIVRDYDYDAYGNEKSAISGDNNPFRYSGEYQDVETGFIYLRNRYYSPSIGRFITEDPAKAGLNWYAYCDGNPVMYIDPWGLIRVPGFNAEGIWSDDPDADDFGRASDTYKILFDLGERWNKSISEEEREHWSNMAGDVRAKAGEGTPFRYGDCIINDELRKNAKYSENYINEYNGSVVSKIAMAPLYVWFVWMTCNEWDYKYNSDWQVPYDKFNGENMNENNGKNWTPWIYYNGQMISADKFGNINLGYVGTKMGFEGILIENMYTMDKDDGPYVKLGIYLAYQ